MTPAEARAVRNIRAWRASPAKFVYDVFGATPDAWQEDALLACGGGNNARRRVAMKACTGPGKAQPVDLLFDTPTGQRRWGDLRAGDWVFSADGTPAAVKAVYPRGVLPMYRMRFSDGSSTLACGEHLWRVKGRTERRHFKSRQCADWTSEREQRARDQGWPITPSDGYVVISTEDIIRRNSSSDGNGRRQFEIPSQGVVYYPHREQPLDPYLLGVWLGDGCKGTHRGAWPDPEIDAEVVRRGYEIRRTAHHVTIYGLSALLRQAGVHALGSHERYVPEEYKQASASQRRDILSGLMDTDGTIGDDGSMSFDVTSERLLNDVAWLVRSLGGIARRRKTKAASYRDDSGVKIECRPCYRLTVTLPFNPFYVAKKAIRWRKPQDRYLTRYIDGIEPEGSSEAMCIEVDHPSHCYLTNDFIVTHNSTVLAWIGWHRLMCFAAKGEHPKGAAISGEGRDNLRDNLWAELAKWQGRSEFLKREFTHTQSQIYANSHQETWFLSARSYAMNADAEAVGRSLSGLHSRFPFVLLDECGAMPPTVGQKASQIFTGGPEDALIAAAGNPTSTTGLLYTIFTQERERWATITVTADPDDPKRTPRVDIEHAREEIAMWGRENAWVMATILGLFPPGGINALLSLEDVEAAMKRAPREDAFSFSQPRLGIDVARFGQDGTYHCLRQGIMAFPFVEQRGARTEAIAGRAFSIKEDFHQEITFVDGTGGYGAGVIDALLQAGENVHEINFSSQAMDPRYFNRRSEMLWLAADWVKKRGALPRSDRIVKQFIAPTYFFQNGKLRVEEKDQIKKRLGFSPDEFDALALTFSIPDQPRSLVPAGAVGGGLQSDWDPFQST